MKKTAIASIFLGLILIVSSCSKTPAPTSTGGSYSFKNISYLVDSTVTDRSTIVFYNTGATVSVGANFSGSTIPTTGGTYTVINTPVAANQISLGMTVNGVIYNNINEGQTATVTVGTNGKLTISGTNITMLSATSATDSSKLTLNVIQQ